MVEGGDMQARQAAHQLDTTQVFGAYTVGFNEAVRMKNDSVRSNNSTSKEANFFFSFFHVAQGRKAVLP